MGFHGRQEFCPDPRTNTVFLQPKDGTRTNVGHIAQPMRRTMFCPHSKVNLIAGHLAILLDIVLPSGTAGQDVVVKSGEKLEPKTVCSVTMPNAVW